MNTWKVTALSLPTRDAKLDELPRINGKTRIFNVINCYSVSAICIPRPLSRDVHQFSQYRGRARKQRFCLVGRYQYAALAEILGDQPQSLHRSDLKHLQRALSKWWVVIFKLLVFCDLIVTLVAFVKTPSPHIFRLHKYATAHVRAWWICRMGPQVSHQSESDQHPGLPLSLHAQHVNCAKWGGTQAISRWGKLLHPSVTFVYLPRTKLLLQVKNCMVTDEAF